ncbi:MAG: membrane-bound lytic murein transglycosylase C [Paraglaciecola sp.]|jgi:membrane-bound lytic murein transglycosylase C
MNYFQVAILLSVLVSLGEAKSQSQIDPLDDEFDSLDRRLEAEFYNTDQSLERRFLLVKEAVEKAYKGLSEKISVNWGSDIKLPSRKTWVTYDDSFETRVEFDFESGTYRIETILDDDIAKSLVALKSLATKIVLSNEAELNAADVFKQQVQNTLKASNFLAEQTSLEFASKNQHINALEILPTNVIELIDNLHLEQVLIPENDEQITNKFETKVEVIGTPELKKLVLTIPFVNNYQKILFRDKLKTIKGLAQKYNIDTSLILAVIEAESSFNPMATSAIPAFGLMQLVPNTAALDSYQFLYGKRHIVSPDFLYNQDNNLLFGTTYLHILSSQYLKDIADSQSKIYCILASYNTGVGNLSKTFVQQKNLRKAISKINTLSSKQTYDHLMANLPADETKHYIQKILARKQYYYELGL